MDSTKVPVPCAETPSVTCAQMIQMCVFPASKDLSLLTTQAIVKVVIPLHVQSVRKTKSIVSHVRLALSSIMPLVSLVEV